MRKNMNFTPEELTPPNTCYADMHHVALDVKSHTTEVACFHTCFSGGMDSLTEDTVITPQLHAV